MNIIAVDDERYALLDLKQVRESVLPDNIITCFSTPEDVLAYTGRNTVSIAFLDIEMDGMNGIELAKRLKDINGKTNIVFVTGYSKYALDSYSVNASGYLMKPVTKKAIIDALEHLRNPVVMQSDKKVRIQTFGNFDVFVDGKVLKITISKAKETLAYLVDNRGTAVTMEQIAAILWEDKNYDRSLLKQTQTVVSQLIKILKDAGAGDIIDKGWNSVAVDVSKFDCDYYQFLNGDFVTINSYTGDYMNKYSWAEMTAGMLTYKK